MISRRAFLKGAAIALVIPLPVLGKITKPQDVKFTITVVDTMRHEKFFTTMVCVMAVTDKPVNGKVRTCYVMTQINDGSETLDSAISRVKVDVKAHFNKKLLGGDWELVA